MFGSGYLTEHRYVHFFLAKTIVVKRTKEMLVVREGHQGRDLNTVTKNKERVPVPTGQTVQRRIFRVLRRKLHYQGRPSPV